MRAHLCTNGRILLFSLLLGLILGLGLCPDEGHSCLEDSEHQDSHPTGMCRNVHSAAEVVALKSLKLLSSQLSKPAEQA